jgi:hypothetical protein
MFSIIESISFFITHPRYNSTDFYGYSLIFTDFSAYSNRDESGMSAGQQL